MEIQYKCEYCDKYYKTNQTLSRHNKIYHNNNKVIKKTENTTCKYCNKKLSNYKSVHRHEQICKKKCVTEIIKTDDINILKKEYEELKQILNTITKNKTDVQLNIDKNTFHKMNALLNNTTNNITYNGTVNNNNITNNNNTNITIIALGEERLNEILSEQEQLNILNKKNTSILSLIEYAHFNPNYPNLHSIILTNKKMNTLYLYDKEAKIFKLTNKDDAINLLIENKVCDIEDFYIMHKDKLDTKNKKIIETIIEDRYENDEKNTINKKMREDVNLLLYNNRHKVKHLLK